MEKVIFTTALLLAAMCNWICLINSETSESSGEVEGGNPRSCEMKEDTNILEVLPGGGWDNLQNLALGQVLAFEYKLCKTTEDGKYLLPDFAFVIPHKYSRLDLFSEMFEKWNTYTSATARSINIEASFPNVVSGSFSSDYQYNKEKQINDQSITTRVQVRHLMYTVKSQPDAPLDPAFKNRLLHIASNLQNNNTEIAWYQTQLLVRDFGTHFTTSVDAGAALIQEDHIKAKFVKDSKLTSTAIRAAASGVLYSKLNVSVGVQNSVSHGTIKEYTSNQTSSRIFTYGGPPFRADFTAADWQENLKDNLVSIDRNGDPLHFVVNSVTLAELPEPTVRRMAKMVEQAIALYYRINTFPGCLDSKSLNFNYMANVADSGSCDLPTINFTLGGVYQNCKAYNQSAGNLCNELDQKNPLTGDYSCPDGYHPVHLLKKASISKSYLKKKCYKICRPCGFLFLGRCCRKVCVNKLYYSNADYDTYWCAADPHSMVPPRSGLMFGGIYTDVSDNPLTGAQRCPNRFYPVPLGGHAHVCISDDYELGYKNSIQFAGFFSCSSGNPLAMGQVAVRRIARDANLVIHKSKVESFMAQRGPDYSYHGPKECPQGYTIHLVIVDNECQINYCIKTGALREKMMSAFKRPPFNPRPAVNPESTEAMAVVGVNGKVWYKNSSSGTWVIDPNADEGTLFQVKEDEEEGSRFSPGETAAVSIVTSLVVGAVILVALFVYRRRKRRQRSQNSDVADVCYNGPAYEEETEDARPPISIIRPGMVKLPA